MNLHYLYRLASSLDTEGKYLEADVVLDSMIRVAQVTALDAIRIFDIEHGTKIDKAFLRKLQVQLSRLHPDLHGNDPAYVEKFQKNQQLFNALKAEEGEVVQRSSATRQRHEQAKQQRQQPQQAQPTQETQQPKQQPKQQPRQQQPRQLSGDVLDKNPNANSNSNQSQQSRQQTQQTQQTRTNTEGPRTQQQNSARPSNEPPTNPQNASPRNQAPRTQTPGTRPYNLGQMNNDVRMRVWNNRSLNPRLYDLLELEHSAGRFNPKTGDLVESAVESLGRAFEKGGPTVVQQGGKAGRGGAAAAAAAKASQFATKAANNPATANIISALTKASSSLSAIKPLLKILPFLGFAASIPEMINLVNKINQKGWKSIWDDPYDRAKAIGVLANTVSAAVSLAPGPLTPVALALSAIGIGSDVGADFARDAGDAYEGGEFKLFGKTVKQKSQQRQQQDALEAGLNAKNIDPRVQSALDASKRMFMAGSKSTDIMNDPKMKFTYPWLGTGDALDTQFKFQLPKLRQSLRSGGAQPQAAQQGQPQQQGQGPYLNKPPYSGAVNQQGQPVYNNAQQAQQQMPTLKNHNDLLYKAYVDTVQTTNVTLDNLKSYRDQIISKIQALASNYPNINAQQAITALDNRIRKYSTQASPA